MAALANLTINDGLATPVARTFNIVDHNSSLVTWRYDNGAPLSGQPVANIQKLRDDNTSRKVRWRVVTPVMESIGSQNSQGYTAPPKVAFVNTAIGDFIINKRATTAQIDDLYAFFINGLAVAQTQVTDPIKKGLFGY